MKTESEMTDRLSYTAFYKDYRGKQTDEFLCFEESVVPDMKILVQVSLKRGSDPDGKAAFMLMGRFRQTRLYGSFYYAAVLEDDSRLSLYKAFATQANQVYGTVRLQSVEVPAFWDGETFHNLELKTKGNDISCCLDRCHILNFHDSDGVVNETGGAAIRAEGLTASLGEVLITGEAARPEHREHREKPEVRRQADTDISGSTEDADTPKFDEARPVLYYTGNTWHRPGDLAMVRGVNLTGVSSIRLLRLPDEPSETPCYLLRDHYNALQNKDHLAQAAEPFWEEANSVGVEILQPSDESVRFRIPDSFEDGVYAVKLAFSDGTARICYRNAPVVEWVQGDEGGIATPGGWLRVFGYNLKSEHSEAASIVLRSEAGTLRSFRPSVIYDNYSAGLTLPDSLEEGRYEVFYYNGCGGRTAFSEPVTVTIEKSPRLGWPEDIFNVLDYGAAGDGRADDTGAIRRTMKAAFKNGGGIVYFPAGRYHISDGFAIPERTVLRGYSAVRTQIYLSPFKWDYGGLPDSIITGTSDFSIEDVSFAGSRTGTLITAGMKNPAKTRNVYIRNCRFHFNSAAGVVTGNWNGELYGLMMDECCHKFHSDLLRIGGENIQITGNDILSSGRPIAGGEKTYFLMTDNKIKPHISNWSPLGRLNGAIIEENKFEGDTVGFSGDNVYYARNSMQNCFNNNREAFTTDLGSGRYNGSVQEGFRSRVLTLKDACFIPDSKAGYGIFIVQGKGAGQYRRILSNTEAAVTLDQPFLISPDSASVCSIMEIRNNMFFSDNSVYNAGVMQFYGMQTNSLFAGTRIERAFGFWGSGRFVYGVYQPNWYCSFVENEISDGIYYWQYGYDAQSGNAQLKISARGGLAGMNVGTLVRRNRLLDNATIVIDTGCETDAMQDLIVEDNFVKDVPDGIVLGIGENTARGVILSRNKCIHTNHPLQVAVPACLDAKDGFGGQRVLIMEP